MASTDDSNNAVSLFSADHIADNAAKDASEAATHSVGNDNLASSFRGSVRNLRASIRNIFFDWGADKEIEKMQQEETAQNIVSVEHMVETEQQHAEEDEEEEGQAGFAQLKGNSGTAQASSMRGSLSQLTDSVRKNWFTW